MFMGPEKRINRSTFTFNDDAVEAIRTLFKNMPESGRKPIHHREHTFSYLSFSESSHALRRI